MGTSQRSDGPGPNVPLLPPWTPDPPPEPPPPDEPHEPDRPDGPPDRPVPRPPSPPRDTTAPPRRYADTRRQLGRFGRTGNTRSLRSGLRHYVSTGSGGAARAASRLAGASYTAQRLDDALTAGSAAVARLVGLLASGESAYDLVDALVEIVSPSDGTQDQESSRAALADALAELLENYPDSNLIALTENQRSLLVEIYVSNEINRRIVLDVGAAIVSKAASIKTAASRLAQMNEYVRQVVAAAFTKARIKGEQVGPTMIAAQVQEALRETFAVFEEYTQ